MNVEPAKRKEIIKDKQFLNWQKLGSNEADIEKIKNQFVSILRDIKSSMQNKELTSTIATAEAIKIIRDALPDKPASDITSDDVANAVAFYMGQTTDLNDKGLTMVQESPLRDTFHRRMPGVTGKCRAVGSFPGSHNFIKV